MMGFQRLTLPSMSLAAAVFVSALTPSFAFGHPQIEIKSGEHEPVAALRSRENVPGIVSAGSTFHDLNSPSSTVETVGSASLVRIKSSGALAVLTAAHVVGGERPWVELDGKRIYPKSVFIDNDQDVAILDLGRRSASSAIDFGRQGLLMTPSFAKSIDDGQVPIVMIAYYQPSHALAFALRPWVDPGVESADTRSVVHAPIVSMSETGDKVRVYTKITSGASGSAVFDLREKSVAGLVVESHYYFSETYLVAPSALNRLFASFVGGARGPQSKTVWKMRNRLAYRVFEDGTEEACFGTRPVSGVIGQPGSGVIGQPGSGVIGQPTNGVIGQPGNGVIGQPSDKKEFLPWTEDPRAVFDFFKIQPGIVWQGQPVLGFRVKAKSEVPGWPSSFLLFGETEAVQFLRDRAAEFSVEPVHAGVDFTDLVRERLAIPKTGETVKLTTLFGPSAIADDIELRKTTNADVEILPDGRIHVRAQTFSKMNRATWVLEPDEIEFTLEKNGAPVGESHFLPVIETKGQQSGEVYYVDLRQFYFADYSQIARPMIDWSTENPPFNQDRFDLKTQLSSIGFSVRNANSGAEFTYGFKH